MFKISKREPEFSTHVRLLNKKETKHLLTNNHYVKGHKEIPTDVERKKQLLTDDEKNILRWLYGQLLFGPPYVGHLSDET